MIFALRTALLMLPVVIVLIALLVRALFVVRRMISRISSPQHRALVIRHFSYGRLYARTACMIIALVALWCALARIQYEAADAQPTYEQGRDLLIALDISRSMLAQDYQTNRLTCAKKKIKTLLQQLASERVGLIVFSGASLVQCPLTKDFASFELFLNALDAESMTHASTDISCALQSALAAFEQQHDRKNKLLVIFTDGEDFSADLPAMQQQAADIGMRVCTIGIATPEGAPIPLYNQAGVLEGHLKDDAGNVVMSRLDEKRLQQLSQQLSGLYIRADAQSDDDVDRLCAWVTSFDKEKFAVTDHVSYRETFVYFAAVGLAFLLIGRFL